MQTSRRRDLCICLCVCVEINICCCCRIDDDDVRWFACRGRSVLTRLAHATSGRSQCNVRMNGQRSWDFG